LWSSIKTCKIIGKTDAPLRKSLEKLLSEEVFVPS